VNGIHDMVADFSEAAYLLARFHPPALTGAAGGRVWERWAVETLGDSGAWVRQGPGQLKLFGIRSASGLCHELDGCGARGSTTAILETKAVGARGPSKEDVMFFDRKTFDLYVARRRAGEVGPHYRLLVSTRGMDAAVRKYCYLYSVIAVDPDLLPLPMLIRIVGRPAARQFFQCGILSDFLRLATSACGPLESRFVPDGPNHLRFDISTLPDKELEDLLWLQEELTGDILELIDVDKPGHFEERADQLIHRLGIQPPPQFRRGWLRGPREPSMVTE
jgi:hypothetical protein